MGCFAEQRASHTSPMFNHLMIGTRYPGTGWLCPPPSLLSTERLLVREQPPLCLTSPRTRCFALQQARAVLELALLRLRHPVHHPSLAVGPKVAGDGVHSSFIFSMPLLGGWIKSLGMTMIESPWQCRGGFVCWGP